jgi:hypothetical protein
MAPSPAAFNTVATGRSPKCLDSGVRTAEKSLLVAGDEPLGRLTNLMQLNVSLLLGNGDGTFDATVLYGPTGYSPVGVVPGDLTETVSWTR